MHRSLLQSIPAPRRELRCRMCGHGFYGTPMDNLPLSETRWHGECPRCSAHTIEESRDVQVMARLGLAQDAEAQGDHEGAARWRAEAEMIRTGVWK